MAKVVIKGTDNEVVCDTYRSAKPCPIKIGIAGVGVVGSALANGFKQVLNIDCSLYDPFKFIDERKYIDNVLDTDFVFVCVSTPYTKEAMGYDYIAITSVLFDLDLSKYKGIVVVKSTISPVFARHMYETYNLKRIVINPEFLTARTAKEDFVGQTWAVVGGKKEESEELVKLYKLGWPDIKIHQTTAEAVAMMKVATNCLFATKIMFMNELYAMWKALGNDWKELRAAMAFHPWVGNMHIDVPGPDGKVGYGGVCFPKEVKAMLELMKIHGTMHEVLEAVNSENSKVRDD